MTADIQGSGHESLGFSETNYDSLTRTGILSAKNQERNSWSLDDYFQYEDCWGNPPQCSMEHIGGGMWTENNWSCNSEYWTATIHGWQPGGRFMDNGSNLVIINWSAKQSLNVSRIPHLTKTNQNTNNVDHTMEAGKEVLHADFWVSAPLSDVTSELQADVTNRDSYVVGCLDNSDACPSPAQEQNLEVTSVAHFFPPGEYFDGREHEVVYFVDSIDIHIATKSWSKHGGFSQEEGTTVRYTTDGTWPTESSTVCPDSVTLTETTSITAMAFKDGQSPSWWPNTVTFIKVNAAPGLVYEYFWDFNSDVIPHYPLYGSGMNGGACGSYCRDKGIIETFSITNATHPDRYGYRFWGYIDIQQEGEYTFYMSADDAAKLFIDGTIIIDREGPFPGTAYEGTGMVHLTEGMHPIVLTYHQNLDAALLDVQWSGPGINKQAIPASVLFHADAPIDSVLPPHYEHYDSIPGSSFVVDDTFDKGISSKNLKIKTDRKRNVFFTLPDAGEYLVEFLSVDGRIASSQKVEGAKTFSLAKPVSSGIFFIRISQPGMKNVIRMVKM